MAYFRFQRHWGQFSEECATAINTSIPSPPLKRRGLLVLASTEAEAIWPKSGKSVSFLLVLACSTLCIYMQIAFALHALEAYQHRRCRLRRTLDEHHINGGFRFGLWESARPLRLMLARMSGLSVDQAAYYDGVRTKIRVLFRDMEFHKKLDDSFEGSQLLERGARRRKHAGVKY
jgi:hypothetical protein